MYESPASLHIAFNTGLVEPGRIGHLDRRINSEDSLCYLLNGTTDSQPDADIAKAIKLCLADLKRHAAKAEKAGNGYKAKDSSLSINLTSLAKDGTYRQCANFWCSPLQGAGEGYFSAIILNGSGKEILRVGKIAGVDAWVKLVKTVIGTQIQRCLEDQNLDHVYSPAEDILDWVREAGKEGQ